MLDAQQQDQWLRVARKYARPGIDAADVLQEACVAAMKANRTDLSTPQNQRYFRGILRKTAWAMMRADTRRKRHEQLLPPAESAPRAEGPRRDEQTAPDLSNLPTSLQAVANLILVNLDRDEIRAALAISDDALRRRLADLRRHIEKHSFEAEAFISAARANAEREPSDIGLVRQALKNWLAFSQNRENAVGTIDPDGHLLAISGKSENPLTNPSRPATDPVKGQNT